MMVNISEDKFLVILKAAHRYWALQGAVQIIGSGLVNLSAIILTPGFVKILTLTLMKIIALMISHVRTMKHFIEDKLSAYPLY